AGSRRAGAGAGAGAILRACVLDEDEETFVVFDASGSARVGKARDGRAVTLVDVAAFAARSDEALDVVRGPYWSCARAGRGRALVGTSGRTLLECAWDERGIERRVDDDGLPLKALGPHTGYVRDVVVSRDGTRAWSCACNFAPSWRARDDGAFEATGDVLKLFTGDILRLALCERAGETLVFCGVADGTVRAFDATKSPADDLGVVGGDETITRGRVSALCTVNDEWVVSGCHDGVVTTHLARSTRGAAVASRTLDGKVQDIVVLYDGRVIVAGSFGVVVYDCAERLNLVDDAFGGVRSAVRSLAKTANSVIVGSAVGDVFIIPYR
ncbi:WD40/YVTN repeat-like-containing domain, partial [Ostreococcus tauri]